MLFLQHRIVVKYKFKLDETSTLENEKWRWKILNFYFLILNSKEAIKNQIMYI